MIRSGRPTVERHYPDSYVPPATPSTGQRVMRVLGTLALVVAALPMLFVTSMLLDGVGKGCTPGHEHQLGPTLLDLSILWFLFVLPSLPAGILLWRRTGSPGWSILGLVLAVAAVVYAVCAFFLMLIATAC